MNGIVILDTFTSRTQREVVRTFHVRFGTLQQTAPSIH